MLVTFISMTSKLFLHNNFCLNLKPQFIVHSRRQIKSRRDRIFAINLRFSIGKYKLICVIINLEIYLKLLSFYLIYNLCVLDKLNSLKHGGMLSDIITVLYISLCALQELNYFIPNDYILEKLLSSDIPRTHDFTYFPTPILSEFINCFVIYLAEAVLYPKYETNAC